MKVKELFELLNKAVEAGYADIPVIVSDKSLVNGGIVKTSIGNISDISKSDRSGRILPPSEPRFELVALSLQDVIENELPIKCDFTNGTESYQNMMKEIIKNKKLLERGESTADPESWEEASVEDVKKIFPY